MIKARVTFPRPSTIAIVRQETVREVGGNALAVKRYQHRLGQEDCYKLGCWPSRASQLDTEPKNVSGVSQFDVRCPRYRSTIACCVDVGFRAARTGDAVVTS